MGRRAKSDKSQSELIQDDLKQLGYDFRINDLDDGLEFSSVSMGGKWLRLTDVFEAVIRTQLRDQGYGKKGKPGLAAVRDTITTWANRNRYNPIKSYFETLASKYQPVESGAYEIPSIAVYFENPDGMFKDWLFKWMVGSIAKLFDGQRNPMLVLVGPQNMGKSFFTEWLCPVKGHFLRDSINPDDKDSHIRLTDVFLWEVEELGATTRRADIESLKAFITRDEVKKRPAYGRHRVDKPATCSFIGTVNHDGAGFLNDPTGSTRFLSCEINAINFDYSKDVDVNKLWSEAFWYYKHVPGSWKLDEWQRAKRNEINALYEVPSALADVISDLYEVTGSGQDFVATQEIRSAIDLHYKVSNEQLFYRELKRVMKRLEVQDARGSYSNGDEHRRGYKGIKRRSI
ncbi:MAG: hypothetical protein KDJ52_01770 [Anaerolineae bacterium]|nr:hypothetical protein [Anaerolineae bacterium]